MNVKEAAVLLGWKKESVKDAIYKGVKAPVSEKSIKLRADSFDPIDISDKALDEFIKAFEDEQPGRYPPVAVRRELRIESGHKCAICNSDLPLQFHHILEWQDLKHHDPNHMLAICGGCHDKINTGQIDRMEQKRYKQLLRDKADRFAAYPGATNLFRSVPTSAVLWNDLHSVLTAMHQTVVSDDGTANSRFDFTDIDLCRKNSLNNLGADSFEIMAETDEPFFGRINSFLSDPRNKKDSALYHETVDEIRRQIAARRCEAQRFDDVLLELANVVFNYHGEAIRGKKRTLRILISFMYFNCDIGRKV
jgi:hypothetical protein